MFKSKLILIYGIAAMDRKRKRRNTSITLTFVSLQLDLRRLFPALYKYTFFSEIGEQQNVDTCNLKTDLKEGWHENHVCSVTYSFFLYG